MENRSLDVPMDAAQASSAHGLPEGTAIVADANGRYRWRATIDLRKNPTMTLLMLKILGLILACLSVMLVVISVISGLTFDRILWMSGIVAAVFAVVAAIAAIGYLIYASILGWTYSADYLMDETGLAFRAAPKEARVSRNVALGTAAVSLLAGNFGVTAASIAASNNEAASRFASVYRVKGIRRHCCIKVSEPFLYNQVYVAPQDYDFVYQFISARCPKATCVER